jgi:hypothetical protein
LAVFDYLLLQSETDLKSSQLSRAMVMYKKGIVLKEFGKIAEAKVVFSNAQTTDPASLWGKLATSEVKEIDAKESNSTQLR